MRDWRFCRADARRDAAGRRKLSQAADQLYPLCWIAERFLGYVWIERSLHFLKLGLLCASTTMNSSHEHSAASINGLTTFLALSSPSATIALYFGLAILPLVIQTLYNAYATPLRRVPGPWLAKFTRFWLFRAINSRKFESINLELHRKYGPVVRIAPNEYSIDDPEAANIIYRPRDQLVKAPRYSAWGLPTGEPNIFTATDIEHAASRRREVVALYSLSALSQIQDKIDLSTTTFLEKMAFLSANNEIVDLSEWFQYYAFDVIGALTVLFSLPKFLLDHKLTFVQFGKQFGFLQRGADIAEIMKTVHNYARYGGVVGVFSEWHPWVFRLLNAMAPGGAVGYAYIAKFTSQAIAEWNARPEDEKSVNAQRSESGTVLHSDYLSTWLAKHNEHPEEFTISDIYYHAFPHVAAGAETTAISLVASIYFLLRHPKVFTRLRQELDQQWSDTPSERISMKEVQDLPYLQAVIKEVLRIFPPTGLPLPRIVPKGGLALAGHFFPAGSIVGINSWVANFNGSVFGPDPDSFRPERWLEDEASSFRMDQYFFTYGRGPRICGGKTIPALELSKAIPELLLRYDIEFADPKKDWTVHNDWFVRQTDFRVRLKLRRDTQSQL
ncbi:MAG: hypothetical protein Q9191_001804 [Dirinaria sp. TL-2023a]